MRTALFAAGICLCASVSPAIAEADDAPAMAASPLVRATDHALLWSTAPGAAARELRRLGFTVRDGQVYPEGITSATVTFPDWTYLELLHFSDRDAAQASAQARAELAFVAQGPGINSVAIEVRDIDAAAAFLRARSFDVADVVIDQVDPDGPDGPKPPRDASWRDFHFARSPVAGVELFFIQYPPTPAAATTAVSGTDDDAFAKRTTHRNGARRLAAVWVLVPDLQRDVDAYARMGFTIGPARRVARLDATTRTATLGDSAFVLVDSPTLAARHRDSARGVARVIGLTIEVDDLARVRDVADAADFAAADDDSADSHGAWLDTTKALGVFLALRERPAATR